MNLSTQYHWEDGLLLHPPIFPKITVDYQSLVQSGDFPSLEDVLMERLDTAPEDIAFYLPAYRALIRKHEEDRASTFLGLHVETLKERGDLRSEIILLQVILGFWQECRYARDLLRDHLKTMYADSSNFKIFEQHLLLSGNATGLEPIRQLELWLRYDEGRIVYIPSKGVGRIREVNPKIGVVRLRLESGEKMSLRIDEAERLSESLTKSHFLARTISETDVLKHLATDDPGELLRLFFASIKREVTLHELREMLSGLVPDSQWNKWWTHARKDTRLIVGSGKEPVLYWNDSVAEGSAVVLNAFLQATTYDKIELLKKHASRSEDLAVKMAQTLAEEASDLLEHDPALSLEIGMTIADVVQCKGVTLAVSPEELFLRDDAGELIADIKNRSLRRKAVKLLAGARDDWFLVYTALLKIETDAAIFKIVVESLYNAGRDDILGTEIEQTLSVQARNPHFYVWLCKEMVNRPQLNKYANWNTVRSLFELLDNSSFKEHHAAVRTLFDLGGMVDKAVETLDVSTSRMLLDILSCARGLEEYRKESVRQKLFTHFPELHKKRT